MFRTPQAQKEMRAYLGHYDLDFPKVIDLVTLVFILFAGAAIAGALSALIF